MLLNICSGAYEITRFAPLLSFALLFIVGKKKYRNGKEKNKTKQDKENPKPKTNQITAKHNKQKEKQQKTHKQTTIPPQRQ